MSAEHPGNPEDDTPPAADSAEFELPAEAERAPTRLRRGLLGVRVGDAKAQIEARDAEIAELKRDLSALWLAFGQHERAIGELLASLERLGGGPPASPAPGPVPPDPVGEQLSSLDRILAAIAEATESLEHTYREHVNEPAEPDAEPRDRG